MAPIETDPLADPAFRALFELAREGILVADGGDGRVRAANQRAFKLLEREEPDLLGIKVGELAAPAGRARLDLALRAVMAGGSTPPFACMLTRTVGQALPVQVSARAFDSGGRRLLLVAFEDQTDRQRVHEDMELRNIAIASVTSGVTVADARQPDLPLIYVNRGFQQITGYTAREAVGRSCRFLQGEDRDQPGLDVLRAALRKGEACVVQLRNYRRDGTLFHNELHISPVRDEQGELTHFVGIQLDVTEQARARASLERSELQTRLALEREQELNQIKTRFISMVSHEFRTPMTGMRASAALLRKFSDKLGSEKKAQHLQNIETSLKRMNRLLDDVLFFSRAESDKVTVHRVPIEPAAYLQQLVESLGPIYPGRDIRVEASLNGPHPYLLDEHLLDHIFHNLIGNAVKYSPPQAPVVCAVCESDGALEFTVTDTGIGIPEADQARLFEAFHRAGNVGTREGTGLGLNIALRAVELLHGTLTFTSRQDHGSIFRVSLPKLKPT